MLGISCEGGLLAQFLKTKGESRLELQKNKGGLFFQVFAIGGEWTLEPW